MASVGVIMLIFGYRSQDIFFLKNIQWRYILKDIQCMQFLTKVKHRILAVIINWKNC